MARISSLGLLSYDPFYYDPFYYDYYSDYYYDYDHYFSDGDDFGRERRGDRRHR